MVAGKHFLRIRRVISGSVLVETHKERPDDSVLRGEAPGRTDDSLHTVSELREKISSFVPVPLLMPPDS